MLEGGAHPRAGPTPPQLARRGQAEARPAEAAVLWTPGSPPGREGAARARAHLAEDALAELGELDPHLRQQDPRLQAVAPRGLKFTGLTQNLGQLLRLL